MESEDDSRSDMSDSDADSFSEIQDELERTTSLIGILTRELETFEEQVRKLQRPILDLYLNQLGDVPFLESSPFRSATFQIKSPGFPGIDMTRRYAFHEICALLRAYLFANDAVAADGKILLPKQLKSAFGIRKKHATFMELVQNLHKFLV